MAIEWILYNLPEKKVRGFSYYNAVDLGLEPRDYPLKIDGEPIETEALLDFKVWGKNSCLGCYFRNIRTGDKFRLTAFRQKRNDGTDTGLYTPKDKKIDFSEPGIENSLYFVKTGKTSKKTTNFWLSAELVLPNTREKEILERLASKNISLFQ